MALSRGALVIVTTIAVVVGLSYALDAPSWFDSARPPAPSGSSDDQRTAAEPNRATTPAKPPGQVRPQPAGPAQEALIRSKIRPAPAASEAAEASASDDPSPATLAERRSATVVDEPARPRARQAVPAAGAGASQERTASSITGPAEAEGGGRTVARVERDVEPPSSGTTSGRPQDDAAEPAPPVSVARATPPLAPPAAERSQPLTEPADRADVAGRTYPADTADAGAASSTSTSEAPRLLDDPAGGAAVGPAEAAAEGEVDAERTGLEPAEKPDERGWGDFGIAMLQRSFDHLFGRDEPAVARDDPDAATGSGPGTSGPPAAVAATGRVAEPPGDADAPALTSKSEETIKHALRAMTARDDPAAAQAGGRDVAAPDLERPSFDIVRVEQDGRAVIAGRAPPGAEVDVLAGDKVIDRVTADRRGSWVSIPAEKLSAGDQTLSLAALKGDGEVVDSEDVVVVAVRADAGAAPRRSAEPPPPQPPTELMKEAPPPQPAQVVPAAAPADDPLAVLLPRDRPGHGRILQAPGRISSDGALTLLVVDYDLEGRVQLSGEAPPGAPIRVYVDNQPAADVVTGEDGSWTTVLKDRLGAGTYTLRLDQLDRQGRPVARLETPFTRVDQPPKEGDVAVDYVIVQPGNSLWRIARRLAGKGMAYVHIYEANRAQIRNPDLIYPGQVFEVPSAFGAAG